MTSAANTGYEFRLVYASGSGAETVAKMLDEGWEPVPEARQVDRYLSGLHMVYLWLRRPREVRS